jgi:ubiquinone/menaquinone biosynthesis C-methylase UbiE
MKVMNDDIAKQTAFNRDLAFWEKRALSFEGYAPLTKYAEGFLKLMTIDPEWTVFDMACGSGALAIPLAPRVKKVTAVDFSQNMLALLERRCKEENISNIRPILGQWDDNWHCWE